MASCVQVCAEWGSIQQAAAFCSPSGLPFVVCRYHASQSAADALQAASQAPLSLAGIVVQLMAWQGPVAIAMAKRVQSTNAAPQKPLYSRRLIPIPAQSPSKPSAHPLYGITKDSTPNCEGYQPKPSGSLCPVGGTDGYAGRNNHLAPLGSATWQLCHLTGPGKLAEAAAWVVYWCLLRDLPAGEQASKLRISLHSALDSLQVCTCFSYVSCCDLSRVCRYACVRMRAHACARASALREVQNSANQLLSYCMKLSGSDLKPTEAMAMSCWLLEPDDSSLADSDVREHECNHQDASVDYRMMVCI